MTGLEALQSVQYVTVGKQRFALVTVDDWEALIEWLETAEDVQAARQALADLKSIGSEKIYPDPDIIVQNIVASADLGTDLNLNALVLGLGMEVIYIAFV